MKQITLNGKKMTDKETAHEYIAKKLGFPEYYGKNLDALADCLWECCLDRYIRFNHFEEAEANLGEYAEMLLAVFTDVAEESTRIRFKKL